MAPTSYRGPLQKDEAPKHTYSQTTEGNLGVGSPGITVEDILPTLMGATEIAAEWPKPIDGVNLWPALSAGEAVGERGVVLARHNHTEYSIAYIEDGWKLVQMPDPATGALHSQLFRISEDPYEENDLAAQRTDVVERLISEVNAIPKGPVAGIDGPPIPTATGLGGPMSLPPDNWPPNRAPYAETAGTD